MFHGIDIRFKHRPEDVYFTSLRMHEAYARYDLVKLLDNVNQVQAIEVTGNMRIFIMELFRNLPTPYWNPTTLYLAGDAAQTVIGQLLHMVLDHNTDVFKIHNETV